MERYVEAFSASRHTRDAQYAELQSYLQFNLKNASAQRDAYFRPDHRNQAAYLKSLQTYRADLCSIIGYPPPHVPTNAAVREELVAEDDLCTIHRLHIPAAAGLEAYGIYLVPRNRPARAPLMLCLHGGGGCPELICNFDGSENYNDAVAINSASAKREIMPFHGQSKNSAITWCSSSSTGRTSSTWPMR